VTLELDLATPLPPVLGDAVQLQQVLVNLLINGTDAMESVPPGRRLLRVRTAGGSKRDCRIHLDVTDAGPGLDLDAKKRLFEPFFTTKPSGLGMGLAICRSIVEAHGGRIQLLEQAGPGTTLRVWLPVRLA
jgi:signal transduction histidine kinase